MFTVFTSGCNPRLMVAYSWCVNVNVHLRYVRYAVTLSTARVGIRATTDQNLLRMSLNAVIVARGRCACVREWGKLANPPRFEGGSAGKVNNTRSLCSFTLGGLEMRAVHTPTHTESGHGLGRRKAKLKHTRVCVVQTAGVCTYIAQQHPPRPT